MTTPWEVLGVDAAAPPNAIRAAYKALLRTAHPDAANGSRAALARVQRAYRLAIGVPAEDELRDIASQLSSIVAQAVATVFDEAGCFVAHSEVISPRVLAAENGRRGRRLQVANGAPFEYYSPSALALYRELRGAAAAPTHCPFASAHALALALAAALPLRAYSHVQRCRVMAPGFLNFSVAHRSLTVSGGKVQCPICGDMCAVGRGMRQHLQSERHCLVGEPLRVALHAAAAAAAAAAPYRGATGADADAPGRSRSSQRHATVDDGGLDLGLLAARDGDLVALRAVVADGDSDWDACTAVDRNGSCALHYAAGGGHTVLCAFLIDELGADVNVRVTTGRRDGRSALHWACRNGHCDTAQWLVAHGAEMRGTNDGTTPFHWAAWQGRRAVCEWIIAEYGVERARATNAFGCNAFHWAALQNDVATCVFLHRLGVDATVLNHQGHSAVHKAAWRGAADVARWLRHSARLPASAFAQPDARGYRPSDIARLAQHDQLAAWLDALNEVVEEAITK